MRPKKLLSLLLALVMVMSMFTITTTTVSAANTGKIKNVIYMIPDGGGTVPVDMADAVKQAGGMNRTLYPYATQQTVNKMYMKDYLIAGVETSAIGTSGPTDSAAAGTALATGYKSGLYMIGINPSNKPVANILEAAQLSGRKTGLVADYEFVHATPAAFGAHTINRSDYRMMAEQMINQGIDVILCSGLNNNMCKYSAAPTEIANRGYTIINNKAQLNTIQRGDKVWSNLPYHSFDYQNTAATPTLAELTSTAIRALENDTGFFMMVEGSSIDTGGHDNNALEMVGNYIAFDEAVKVAIEYAKGRTDTVVMIAPDHDTGGMNIVNKSTAVTQIRNGQNPTTAGLTWSSKDHTARNGGVYLYVPAGISYPSGTSSNPGVASNYTNYVIGNNKLAPYLADCMGINLDTATSQLFVNVSSMGTYTRTYDSESGSNNFTGTFKFNNANCTIDANQSYAMLDGKKVDLDGQIAVYEYYTGKFYVPQKLLNYINGTEVPDDDATTGGGTSGNTSLITETSITSMGTAATFWGNVSSYENVTNNGNTSFTIQPGGYVTFNVPVANAGLYYLQVKSSGGNTMLDTITNDVYYAMLPVKSAEANYYFNNGNYEFLYLPTGKTTMKMMNVGNEACTISDIQLVATKFAVDAGVTPTRADAKIRATWTYAAQDQAGYFNKYTSGNENTTTLAPGAYTTVTVSGLPYSGIYAAQLKLSALSGTAKVRLTTGNGYYADYELTAVNTWTNRMTPPKDEPIYFNKGDNTLYIENIGSTAFTMAEYDFGMLNAGNHLDFSYLLKQSDRLPGDGTVVPVPTATPVPTPTLDPNTVSYTAPCAGVFQVTSDKAVTLTNETGHIVTLAAGATGKLFLVKGFNKITTTDTSANLTFNVMKNQGLDYVTQVATTGFTITDENATSSAFTVAANSSTTLNVTVPASGMYYLSYQKWNPTNEVYTMETDTGLYAAVKDTTSGWNHYGLDNTVEYVYLREGANTITVKNPTSSSVSFEQVRVSKTSNFSTALGWDNVKVIVEEGIVPTPTTTPTPTTAPTATPTPTVKPTATPTPTSAPSGNIPPIPAKTIDSWNGKYSNVGIDYGTEYFPGGSKVYVGSEVSNYATDYYKAPGSSVIYTYNAPYTGVYVFQTFAGDYAKGTAGFEISTEEGYYWQVNRTKTGWSSGDGTDALIFLREGENEITVTWNGEGSAGLYEIDIGLFNESGDYSSMAFYNLVPYRGTEVEPTPTPTPAPTGDITFTAPCAGVYEVTSDKAVTLTNETGHKVSLTAGTTGKLFLVKGENVITTTDKTASLTFTVMENQGVDYITSVATNGQFTITLNDVYYSTPVTVPANSSVTINVDVAETGMYYLSYQKSDAVTNEEYIISTDTGFYGAVKNSTSGWNHYAADGTLEYAYIKAGANTITITNPTNTAVTFNQIRLSDTTGTTAGIGWDNVKIVIEEIEEPEEPEISEFKNFALNGDTASVSYVKTSADDTDVVTLYVAEYAGNKLVQINLVVIDLSLQEVGTAKDYSVSLPSASSGTVKAMLLTNNLVPLF